MEKNRLYIALIIMAITGIIEVEISDTDGDPLD